jgi:hypothetical protein
MIKINYLHINKNKVAKSGTNRLELLLVRLKQEKKSNF